MDKVKEGAEEYYDMFAQKMRDVTKDVTNVFTNKPTTDKPILEREISKKTLTDKKIVIAHQDHDIIDYTNANKTNNNVHNQQLLVKKPEVVHDFDLAYLQERDNEIRKVQKDMIEVNQIFKDLSELIDSQAPMIDSIANNITSTKDQVESANKDLEEADKKQSNNTGLIFFGVSAGTIVTVVITALLIALV